MQRLLKKEAGLVLGKGNRKGRMASIWLSGLRHVGFRKDLGEGNEQEQEDSVT